MITQRRILLSCVAASIVAVLAPEVLAQQEISAGNPAPADGYFLTVEEMSALRSDIESLERDLALSQEKAKHQSELNSICVESMATKVANFTEELEARQEEILWKDTEIETWETRWEECEAYARKVEKRAGGGILNNRTVTFITDALVMGAAAWAWQESH